ncbi:hypothetical protein CYLTODRAFT_490408 [Cylindrobasidium torrendii FP15055 ss-10]|uniref:Uncharacterized protein n=1 Tax=Cylindrobasidium torrendii FP15055 ss-10 TaxID=1314674 RepID=A0A0D7BB21_9AGAR|nr:hypothetical protein CYLTODRAFT_490408 [Cylindrobasidium torrendii FP15055 ss-10]
MHRFSAWLERKDGANKFRDNASNRSSLSLRTYMSRTSDSSASQSPTSPVVKRSLSRRSQKQERLTPARPTLLVVGRRHTQSNIHLVTEDTPSKGGEKLRKPRPFSLDVLARPLRKREKSVPPAAEPAPPQYNPFWDAESIYSGHDYDEDIGPYKFEPPAALDMRSVRVRTPTISSVDISAPCEVEIVHANHSTPQLVPCHTPSFNVSTASL